MALTLKTPGVYIKEVSKLPPSVAAVGTAIPAFIGYTEIPGETSDDLPVPVRIGSMLDYESIFGFAPNQEGISASVIGDDIQVSGPNLGQKPKYLMYYSVQLYFANGGGPCYIASVGDYSTGIVDLSKLQDGLAAIEKEDETTLLVFPDAKAMSDTHFYTIYKSAIEQCHKLQDRFTIMDTYNDNPINSLTYDPIAKLRDGINLTTEYLKYSAAYYPFLSTLITYQYKDEDVAVTITPSQAYDAMAQIVADEVSIDVLETVIFEFEAYVIDVNTMTDLQAVAFKPTLITSVHMIINEIANIRKVIEKAIAIGNEAVAAAPDPNDSDVIDAINAIGVLNQWITDELASREFQLTQAINAINAANTQSTIYSALSDTTPGSGSVYEILGYTAPNTFDVLETIEDVTDPTEPLAELIIKLAPLSDGGSAQETDLEAIKDNKNVLYNQIKAAISQLPLVLPPSSAMAGVYARVDNNNGVWTSPANVGLNYVIKPTYMVDREQQEDMNVTTTGKSVNAIRTFTGKGTLVWGARTMAGNDNEWRYISVRRFFNFVEESIQKASESFVFAPNDANTWVRLRAMIENFLNLQWRAGALTGAKPEQAYYVRVGLRQTMTAQDILEGRMIIEIGLAAVRPAEFIVLEFSHKMQEA